MKKPKFKAGHSVWTVKHNWNTGEAIVVHEAIVGVQLKSTWVNEDGTHEQNGHWYSVRRNGKIHTTHGVNFDKRIDHHKDKNRVIGSNQFSTWRKAARVAARMNTPERIKAMREAFQRRAQESMEMQFMPAYIEV